MGTLSQSDYSSSRQEILSLTIKEVNALYEAYISFTKNGGLFIPAHKNYRLGDEVFIELTLMDEPEKIPIAGRVVWVTPPGAQGHRAPGIGVQFNEINGGNNARAKIETYLAGMLKSEKPTQTM